MSVVIPCYNQARYLSEAIESVLAQSHKDFEIVVIDDGSTDDTSKVAARYPAVRLIRQDNRGLSAARNVGLGRSEGEYVVFLDADDRLLPEALEAGLKCLKANPECAFASGRYRFVAEDGSFLRRPRERLVDKDSYAALLQRNYIGPPPVVVYRRDVLDSVGGFDTSLRGCEDYDTYLRIVSRYPICSHEEVVAEYRRHGTNASSNHALILSTSMAVLRKHRKHVKGNSLHQQAYTAGVKHWRGAYGDRLVEQVRTHLREREWNKAFRGLAVLARHYPRGILLLDERRMERHRLPRRLKARKEELEARERRLKGLEAGGEESGGGAAAEEERQEVRLLRGRVCRLERRMQELEGQGRIWRFDKIKKSLKRLSGVWAKVSRTKGDGSR